MADISKSGDWPKKEIFDGLYKCLKNDYGIQFPKREILMTYIGWSCDWPKKEIFDSLCKHPKSAFGGDLPKKEISF